MTTYRGFLGTWELITDSCQYDQGEPPQLERHTISERGGLLHIAIERIDADGTREQVELSGPPDGTRQPLEGGELADELALTATSPRELVFSAYSKGRELMVAQRQLDDTGTAMRVVQLVRLPDGSRPVNVGIYRRVVASVMN